MVKDANPTELMALLQQMNLGRTPTDAKETNGQAWPAAA